MKAKGASRFGRGLVWSLLGSFCALAALPLLGDDVLVPAGAVWKYLDNGSDQGTAWRQLDFNDSAWASGAAQLGYGDGDEVTLVGYGPNSSSKYITTYFRRRFELPDAASVSNMTLRLLRDDGAVVYLNGVEIFRSSLAAGPVSYTTLASSAVGGLQESTEFVMETIPPDALREGVNVVAVEVHQISVASSDLSFDLELIAHSGEPTPEPRSVFLAIQPVSYSSYVVDISGQLHAWGYNGYGQLGVGDTANQFEPVAVSFPTGVTAWKSVAAGTEHAMALDSEGHLFATGWLADGVQTRFVPLPPPAGVTHWRTVSHAAGIASDGGLYVLDLRSALPNHSLVLLPANVTGWQAIASGDTHHLALANNGQIYAWGGNFYAQLGLGFRTTSGPSPFAVLTPTRVPLPAGVTHWKAVVAGGDHSLAIASDDRLYAWGNGFSGQVGIEGVFETVNAPAAVSFPEGVTRWTAVSGGYDHTLAIGNNGQLYAWGDSEYGQAGNPSTGSVPDPVRLPSRVPKPAGVTQWTRVAAGKFHSLALADGCQLYSWGYNGVGALGVPTISPGSPFPHQPVHVSSLDSLCGPSSNRPPIVSIVTPSDGAVFTAPATLTLIANANDPDGYLSLQGVEFFGNGTSLGFKTNLPVLNPLGPFVLSWSNVPAGAYMLTAVAVDAAAAKATSAPVRITVTKEPTNALVSLISTGSVWRYLDNGTDQGSAWRALNFDDGAWARGPAQLGYGDGDEATLVSFGPNSSSKYITTYFRRPFELANAANFSSLTVRLLRDDGAVVYLNGVEIFRSNLPPGPISYTTLALSSIGGSEETSQFVSANVDRALLVNGLNVVAVELHQVNGASADVSFDLELSGEVGPPPPQQAVVKVVATDPEARELPPWVDAPPNDARFTVSRTGNTNVALNVHYTVSGTAVNGVDYTQLPDTIEIPAGVLAVEVGIYPLYNPAPEGTETVVLTLELPVCIALFPPPPECYLVGPSNQATAFIADWGTTTTNPPPVVQLNYPQDQQEFAAPANILLQAYAQDTEDGYELKVEFFAGTNNLGVGTFVPTLCPEPYCPFYTLMWSNVPPGNYALRAKATDSAGASTISAPVQIAVRSSSETNLPVVTITEPADGAVFYAPTSVVFSAQAVHNPGSTSRWLDLYLGTNRVGGTAGGGVNVTQKWTVYLYSLPAGNHVLTATARDNLGNRGTSAPLRFTIVVPANTPPVVRIVSPANDAVLAPTTPLPIQAEAVFDPACTFKSIKWYRDGTVHMCTHYDYSTNNVVVETCNDFIAYPGSYSYTAVASDNFGNFVTSPPVQVTIVSNSPPADRELHVVGLYSGAAPGGGSSRDHEVGDVAVDVNRPGKRVTLVLSCYEPARWHLTIGDATTVERIILGGYYRQTVEGVGPEVEIIDLTYPTSSYLFVGSTVNCIEFYGVVQKLHAITGLEVLSFHGAYTAPYPTPIVIDRVQDDPRLLSTYPQPTPLSELPNLSFRVAFFDRSGGNVFFRNYSLGGPQDGPLLLPSMRVVPDSGDRYFYGTEGHEVWRVDAQTSTGQQMALGTGLPELSWPSGLTFDSARGRVLLVSFGGEGHLYSYSPNTEQWSLVRSMNNHDVQSLEYQVASDALYALSLAFGECSSPSIEKFDANGEFQSEIPLALQSYGFSFGATKSALVSVGEFLVLLLEPAYPGGDQRQESRMYLIDPRTGQSWLTYRQILGPENKSPTVQIVWPSENMTLPSIATNPLVAEASDPDGLVASVEFFANGASLGFGDRANNSNTRFTLDWINPPAGSYTMTARATDGEGAVRVSSPVHITVNTNTPPNPGGDRELHAISVSSGAVNGGSSRNHELGNASIVVNRPGKRVSLCLSSYEPVLWQVSAVNGTIIEKVILGGYYAQQIEGVGPETEIVNRFYNEGEGTSDYILLGMLIESGQFFRGLQKLCDLTGMGLASFQGAAVAPYPTPFVIDQVQNDARLHCDYPRPVDPSQLPDLRFRLAFNNGYDGNVTFQDYTLLGPASGFEFFPAWRVVTDADGRYYYGADFHESWRVDTQTHTFADLPIPSNLPEFSWPVGITFDPTRNRILVATLVGEGYLYAYSPVSGQWSLVRGLDNEDLDCLTYHAPDDSLYGVTQAYYGGGNPPSLLRFNESGQVLGEIRLPVQPPGVGVGGFRSELVSVGEYLVLLLETEAYVPDNGRPEARIYLVDPRTGEIWLTYRRFDAPQNQPPSVNLLSPSDGASFPNGSSIRLQATAYDFDGEITSVQFLDGDQIIGLGERSPDQAGCPTSPWRDCGLFELVWLNPAPGQHSVTATARDWLGAVGVSAPVNITMSPRTNGIPVDTDSDADGVPDVRDECPNTPVGSVVNAHGCSLAQLCPCDGPWRNHGEYVSSVVRHAWTFYRSGLITADERQTAIREAAQSVCGKQGTEPEPVSVHVQSQTLLEMRRDGFRFILSGDVPGACVLECSTDLTRWIPIQTNRVAGLEMEIADPEIGQATARFYRVRVLPSSPSRQEIRKAHSLLNSQRSP